MFDWCRWLLWNIPEIWCWSWGVLTRNLAAKAYIYITHKSCVIWDTVLPDCFYHLLYSIPEELEPHHEIINVTNFSSSCRNSRKPQTPTNQTTFSQSEPSEKSFIIMKQEKQSLTYHHIKHHSTLYQSLCHQHINIQHYIIILSSLYHHVNHHSNHH